MRCSKAEKMLTLLAGGELESFRRSEIEKHLSECENCRRIFSQYKRLLELTHNVPPVQIPDALNKIYVNEIMDRTLDTQRAGQIHRQPLPPTKRFPFRRRMVGAAAAIAIAAIAAFIAIGIDFLRAPRGAGVEDYLVRSDLVGLSKALKNDDFRHRILDEPVSVDLLIQTVEELQKPRALHGRVEQYVARSLLEMKTFLQALPASRTNSGLHTASLFATCADIDAEELRLEKILRTLRCLRRCGERITVRELLRGLDTARDTKEAIG